MKTTNKAKSKNHYGFQTRVKQELEVPVLKAIATETLKRESRITIHEMVSELVAIGMRCKYPELLK